MTEQTSLRFRHPPVIVRPSTLRTFAIVVRLRVLVERIRVAKVQLEQVLHLVRRVVLTRRRSRTSGFTLIGRPTAAVLGIAFTTTRWIRLIAATRWSSFAAQNRIE